MVELVTLSGVRCAEAVDALRPQQDGVGGHTVHVSVHQGGATVKGLDGGGHLHHSSSSNEHLGLEVECHVHGLHATEALGDDRLVVRDYHRLVNPDGVIIPVGLVCSRRGNASNNQIGVRTEYILQVTEINNNTGL